MVVRSAVRKKGVDSGFLVESSVKDGSAKCARNQQSYDGLCCDWKGTTTAAKAQWSNGGGVGKSRGGERATTTASEA